MNRDIKPLKVSPLIKSARWSLLFLGFIYGVRRKHNLEIFDAKAVVERKRLEEEYRKNMAILNKKRTNEGVKTIFMECGSTDIPEEFQD